MDLKIPENERYIEYQTWNAAVSGGHVDFDTLISQRFDDFVFDKLVNELHFNSIILD